jgi:hypothetical protein
MERLHQAHEHAGADGEEKDGKDPLQLRDRQAVSETGAEGRREHAGADDAEECREIDVPHGVDRKILGV